MANIPVIEESFLEVSRAIGLTYDLLNTYVGDIDTPGTALFYLAQLQNIALTKLPRFGIIDTTPASFVLSVDPSRSNVVTVSQGWVGYKGQQFYIPQQEVSISRVFGSSYTTNARYGVRIGLPLVEIERASSLYSTIVSESASFNDTTLKVADLTAASILGFPLQAQIGARNYIVFSGLTADGTRLVVDISSNEGKLPTSFGAGTRVNFIYDPRVIAVAGTPVESGVAPVDDPIVFGYYPPLPSTWLPIAELIVANPNTPEVADRGGNDYAIHRTAFLYPAPNSTTPFFSVEDAKTVATVIQSTISSVKQNADRASVAELINGLEQYTKAVAQTSNTTFRQYWASRPFRANGNFGSGVSFDDLERFTFPKNFIDAYYNLRRTDLHHTFAVFRGDRYQVATPFAPIPGGFASTTSPYACGTGISTLARGTYTYGVSVVYSTGESPVVYSGNNTNLLNFINEITYPDTTSALYYHLYRRANESGDITEYRLTAPYDLTAGVSALNTRNLGYAPNGGGLNLIEAGATKIAFKISPTSDTWSGGIAFRAKKVADFATSTAPTLSASFYSGNNTSSLILITDALPISLATITSSYTGFVAQFENFGVSLDRNTSYWIVFNMPSPDTFTSIAFETENTGGATAYATSTGTSWTAGASARKLRALYLGVIDNGRIGTHITRRGVLLTDDIANSPQRLRVFVPPVDFDTSLFTPTIGADTTADKTLIQNEIIVSLTAQNGISGTPRTFSITVPRGTSRGTQFLIGGTNDKFDRVTNVSVRPGAQSNLSISAFGAINWSSYDLVTVETVP